MKCIHKETGATGEIIQELKATRSLPPQWGIYWDKNAYSYKMPNHYYWNDKDKISIIYE